MIKLGNAHDHDEIAFACIPVLVCSTKPTCIWAPTKSAGVPLRNVRQNMMTLFFWDPEKCRKFVNFFYEHFAFRTTLLPFALRHKH